MFCPVLICVILTLVDCLAASGAGIHAATVVAIGDAFGGIDEKISNLAEASSTSLSRAESLYNNISYPLSATLCHSDKQPRATIAEHLATLHGELASAGDKLRALQADWQECVMSQQEAWQELNSPSNDFENSTVDFNEYKKKVKAVARAANQDLDALDTASHPLCLGLDKPTLIVCVGVQGILSRRNSKDNAPNHGQLRELFYKCLFFLSCLSLLYTLISLSAIAFTRFWGLAR